VDVPDVYRDFPCGDYFASEWSRSGYWDEAAQLWLLVPADEAEIRGELQFLVIGRPGVDGIEFGYRRGLSGIWAFYPVDREFVFLTPTIDDLLTGWNSGAITV
jgi:hypothetical protein